MSKINQIFNNWPSNTLVTTSWLKEKGVSRQLADSYKKSGWFESFGSGAYKRPHEEITWAGALYTLQKLNKLPVHVGGKTALELQGYGHYVMMRWQKVILWKEPDVRLPVWFQNHEWNESLQVRSARLFNKESGKLTEKK